MQRYVVVLYAFTVVCVAQESHINFRDRPKKGTVWPKPQHHIRKETVFIFDPGHFHITKVGGVNCSLLSSIITRYSHVLSNRSVPVRWRGSRLQSFAGAENKLHARLEELRVELMGPCDDYPQFEMEESYTLSIKVVSTLKSISIWGILRGLQTLSQLLYFTDDYNEILISAADIFDFPRYSHRGLLLDTSRHFISLHNILLTLDAMEMNKMDVFHWHIVDDESFPYQSEILPALSMYGAYDPTMVYTKADVALVVQYARDRGIRVVPEFDVPGHTRSWGKAYPNILTSCNREGKLDLGPMDPINNATYKLLKDLIHEVQEWFPDKYLHIGGEEVDFRCWVSNPALRSYMDQHESTSLYKLFMSRVISLLGDKLYPIVWQEVFEEDVALPDDTLVQLWREWPPFAKKKLYNVLKAGCKVLISNLYYLDPPQNWDYYYENPETLLLNYSLADNIVGGEACMWTENVDDRNLINRVWPRASAVAEVLWSSTLNRHEARSRLEEHTCRMIRRGIAAQPPNGPGFCVV